MKNKIVVLLVIGFHLIFGTDMAKLNKLMNFSNYKKYKIEFDYQEFRTNRFKVKESRVTNGKFNITIEAMLFKNDEGKLEDLTKAQIDALPESPYKYFQQMKYACQHGTDFDRDIAFLYHSGEARDSSRDLSTKITNYFQQLRVFKDRKIVLAMRAKEDNIFFVYRYDYIKPDGSIAQEPWLKYAGRLLGKENGKWVQVDASEKSGRKTGAMTLIRWWAEVADKRQVNVYGGLSLSGSSDDSATFLDGFKEVE